MVICNSCKFKHGGCVLKKAVLASNSSCSLYSVQVMEKIASEEEYTVSWPAGGKVITQTNKGGKVVSSQIRLPST